jgi:hypothetical protein
VPLTDTQLFLSIGIPSLLVVLSWINNNARFNGIDKRIDGLDKRLDGFESRLDSHDRRFDDIQAASHKDALEILRSMTSLHERVAVVETKQGR